VSAVVGVQVKESELPYGWTIVQALALCEY